jgi:hypothetical protein
MNEDFVQSPLGTTAFKYHEYLKDFSECPPASYESKAMSAFRWVHFEPHQNDFLPVHLIPIPPDRAFNPRDKSCIGFRLSIFGSFEDAKNTYLYIKSKSRPKMWEYFVSEKGDTVAELGLLAEDGVVSPPSNQGNGHYTFHEYKDVDLYARIISKTHIAEG